MSSTTLTLLKLDQNRHSKSFLGSNLYKIELITTSVIEMDDLSNFCRIILIKVTFGNLGKAKKITNYVLNS